MSTPALPTTASVLSITEVTGFYYVSLYGRAQPYRPISVGGKQRVEFTWYPGSAAATTQPLGPEEAPITMRGYWKDKFINDSYLPQVALGTDSVETTPGRGSSVSNSTGGFSAAYSANPIPVSVIALTQHVDTMRRRGQFCKFEWDSIVRYGHITDFVQTWHNTHDCEWELTFTPSAQEDVRGGTPVFAQVQTNQQAYGDVVALEESVAVDLKKASAQTQSTLNLPFSVAVATAVNAVELQVAATTSTVYSLTVNAANNVLAVPQASQRIVSALTTAALNMQRTYAGIADTSLDLVFNFSGYNGREFCPLAKQVAAFSWQRDAAQRFNAAAVQYAADAKALSANLSPELLGAFVARQDMDLRDVSSKYYGSPDYWGYLKDFNGLTTSKLSAGTTVFVPILNQGANQQTVPTNAGY